MRLLCAICAVIWYKFLIGSLLFHEKRGMVRFAACCCAGPCRVLLGQDQGGEKEERRRYSCKGCYVNEALHDYYGDAR